MEIGRETEEEKHKKEVEKEALDRTKEDGCRKAVRKKEVGENSEE
jgi:hypothetical protein